MKIQHNLDRQNIDASNPCILVIVSIRFWPVMVLFKMSTTHNWHYLLIKYPSKNEIFYLLSQYVYVSSCFVAPFISHRCFMDLVILVVDKLLIFYFSWTIAINCPPYFRMIRSGIQKRIPRGRFSQYSMKLLRFFFQNNFYLLFNIVLPLSLQQTTQSKHNKI